MEENPAIIQINNSANLIFSIMNRSMSTWIFKITIRKTNAPPAIQNTALFGVASILNISEVHDLFDRITAIFEHIRVTKVRVLMLFSEYPIFSPIK